MARYPADQKQKTRTRLLEVARGAFRRRGFDGVSIDRLMQQAGLTRGGFYAHFASKEALVNAVLGQDSGLLRGLQAAASSDRPRADALAAFAYYLDPAHRAGLVECPMVAHPMDALRGGAEQTRLYAEQIQGLIDTLAKIVDPREAMVLGALAVGAAILSTTLPDGPADQLQNACLEEIRRRLG